MIQLNGRARHTGCRSAIFACVIVFYVSFIARSGFRVGSETYFSLFDDAMISMRYGRHLAQGFGLVWNPGENPVEGYSNLLWTLWMALIHVLPVSEAKTSLVVMGSGVLILLANLWVVYRIAQTMPSASRVAGLAAVVITAFYYPLVYWTLRGLEVGLLTLLIDTSVLLAFQLGDRFRSSRLWLLSIMLAMAFLTRDDAIVPIAVVAVYVGMVGWKDHRVLCVSVLLVAVVGVGVGHAAFRLYYYGDVLPNTYYLKLTEATLSERLWRGLVAFASVLTRHLFPLFAAGILGLVSHEVGSTARSQARVLFAIFVAQSTYSVWVGGDAWEWMNYANRFLCVSGPSLAVLSGLYLDTIFSTSGSESAIRQVRKLAVFLGIGMTLGGLWDCAEKIKGGFYRFDGLSFGVGMCLAGVVLLCATGKMGRVAGERSRRGLQGYVADWSQYRPGQLAAAVVLVLVVVANGKALAQWTVRNALGLELDVRVAKIGLLLRIATSPDARIGVVLAGATPYFSHRSSVDLLGKNDRWVAKARPTGPFYPGHNKWDLGYSIGQLRPDVIAHVWDQNSDAAKAILAFGYRRLSNGLYVSERSDRLNSQLIGRQWSDPRVLKGAAATGSMRETVQEANGGSSQRFAGRRECHDGT
jgi:hypothetical protein